MRTTKGPTNLANHRNAQPREQGIPHESLADIKASKLNPDIAEIVHYNKTTRDVGESNRFYLERWAERCGSVRLQLITPAMLRNYVDRGQTSGSQRRELGALIAAVNHWLRENDPMSARSLSMARPADNPGRDRYVTVDEELAMELAFPPELWAVARFCLRTGARPFEARALTGKDFNAQRGTVKLRHRKGQNKLHVREVPVRDEVVLADLLERLKASGHSELFRCQQGGPWIRTNLARQFERYAALAGLVDLKWTDLRHTFATRVGRGGASATTIADLLGHTNLQLVMRYVQTDSLDREAAISCAVA